MFKHVCRVWTSCTALIGVPHGIVFYVLTVPKTGVDGYYIGVDFEKVRSDATPC